MMPKPRADLKPNTADFERLALVKPTGFREYDARWLFPDEINLMGLNAVGMGLAKLFENRGVKKRIVVGHDYRSYSAEVKQALMMGLLAGGCEVHDIGLALSPMAYFAQFALDVRRGRDGHRLPQRQRLDRRQDGPVAAADLRPRRNERAERDRARAAITKRPAAAATSSCQTWPSATWPMLIDRPKLKRQLKVVAACGNGTAGAFAPQVLEAVGCEVIPLDAELDYSFPRYNPNPKT